MKKILKPKITSKEFLDLSKRDFDNGAIMEAIFSTLKYYESLLAAKTVEISESAALRTEQELHNAWRKRAEEAEAKLLESTMKDFCGTMEKKVIPEIVDIVHRRAVLGAKVRNQIVETPTSPVQW